MKSTITIAGNLDLPLDVVTQSLAILARKRAGKSYTGRRFAEELLEANQQVVILDPKGDWWGIRWGANGKTPGFPVVVLGGEHGDLPLEKNAAETIARLIVEERVSVLLDLSDFKKYEIPIFLRRRPEARRRRFAGASLSHEGEGGVPDASDADRRRSRCDRAAETESRRGANALAPWTTSFAAAASVASDAFSFPSARPSSTRTS